MILLMPMVRDSSGVQRGSLEGSRGLPVHLLGRAEGDRNHRLSSFDPRI